MFEFNKFESVCAKKTETWGVKNKWPPQKFSWVNCI